MNDLKRQIEILALIQNGANLSKADWAYKYSVSEITINRDLKELRNKGVSVFSKNGRVILNEKIDKNVQIELITVYYSLSLYSETIVKKLTVILKQNGEKHFSIITLIAKAIHEKLKIDISYKRFYDNEIGNYLLKPISIDTSELNWILTAYKDGEEIPKSFYLNRIESIKLTNLKFKIPSTNKKEKLSEIVLRFNPKVKNEIKDKIWFEDYEFTVNSDNYITLKTNQPITNKLSAWCITWWDMIEIISPKELKNHTLDMIEDFMKINK